MDENDMANRRARLLAKRDIKKAEILNLKKYDKEEKYEEDEDNRVIIQKNNQKMTINHRFWTTISIFRPYDATIFSPTVLNLYFLVIISVYPRAIKVN